MKSKSRSKSAAVKAAKPSRKSVKSAVAALDKSCLPAGVLTVTVTQFRSLGAITPLQATVSDWTGFKMPAGIPMPQPAPTLTLTEGSIVVCSQYPVRLIFNMPDSNYVLTGIAWEEVVPNAVGEKAFPDIYVQRGSNIPVPYGPEVVGGSSLTVTDNAQEPGNYNYVLLIQDAITGEIGVLDPGMDNHPDR